MNRSVFLRQLRYWTFHCSVNAIPSFCIAMIHLELWSKPASVAAMLLAVATFILLYARITSFKGPLTDTNHALAQSLRLGTKIRAWISGLSLLLIFTPAAIFVPDLWCGFIAFKTIDMLVREAGSIPSLDPLAALNIEFVRIYLVTMLEGLILSGMLFGISLLIVMVRRVRDEIAWIKFSSRDSI